ncbi:MAG: hypothetical protein R3F02_17575 [Thiolinea sp.]
MKQSSRSGKYLFTALIIAGVCLILFFGFKSVRSFLLISFTGLEQGVADVSEIRGWMTIPYIAAAYRVPEDKIYQAAGIPPATNSHHSLRKLGHNYYADNPRLILDKVQQAIRDYQAAHPETHSDTTGTAADGQ